MAKAKSKPQQQNAGTRYFREVYSEMSRVVWPSREQAMNLTAIVVVVMLALGAFLGVIDFAFEQVFEALLRIFT